MKERLAITVVAGQWGAGKSEVVDRVAGALPDGPVVLCDAHDHERHQGVEVVHVEHEVVYANRDCPCCAVRADLVEAVEDLLCRRTRPGHVLIEAVAGSDVAIIVQSFLRTAKMRDRVRVAGLVTVVDGHAVATATQGDPALVAGVLDHDAVAMADLVVVNRLERLVPAVEQRTGWDIWACTASGQVHIDVADRTEDPLPARILGLAGFDVRSGPTRLTPTGHSAVPVPRYRDRVLVHGDRPLRHIRLEVPGVLDRDGLDDWVAALQRTAGPHLLRWRGEFTLARERHRWLGQGVRTTIEVDDGPAAVGPAANRIELIGRVPPAEELVTSLAAARP